MDTLSSALVPHRIESSSRAFSTKVVEFENGSEQRYAGWHKGKNAWKFSWNCLTNAEITALQAFFDAQAGQLKSWMIIDARIGTRILRFKTDQFNVTRINAKVGSVDMEVMECLT